jgi:hypothetical protein
VLLDACWLYKLNGNCVSLFSSLSPKSFFLDNFPATVTNLHTWMSVEVLTLQEHSCKCDAKQRFSVTISSLIASNFILLEGVTYIIPIKFHRHLVF